MSGRAPAASVLLVAHGAWDWTAQALAALAEHTPQPHEVILVDNGSADDTAASVRARHPDVVLLENPENTGFGPGNNQAAAVARAPVLVLLNTDAIVGPGWLAPLLAALQRPGVGAVVPQLLNLDGSLQEAGALLAADGTVASHGAGADADDPAFCFPRVVDYGAGACMAVRAELFAQVRGFDDRYAPAYYEDADLCLQLAAAGWATVYEPGSRVVHARHGSSSGERARELSDRNRARFVERWGATLATRPPTLADPRPPAVLAARDAVADGRVLVIEHGEAEPAELLDALLELRPGARVTLLTAGPAAARAAWTARGVEVAAPADAAAWLADRRWHADLVIGADGVAADALEATQPQALIVGEQPAPGELRGVLARAGLR